MPRSYTVLWTKDHCSRLKLAGETGKPLRFLFGGIHQSAPSFKRAGVNTGDLIFPVMVSKGDLFVITCARVNNFTTLADYVVRNLGFDTTEVAQLNEYQIKEIIEKRFTNLGQRQPYGCETEVIEVAESTPLTFSSKVPSKLLTSIYFCPQRGQKSVLKYLEDGKLKSSLSLQGNIRRLCQESANLFFQLTNNPEKTI